MEEKNIKIDETICFLDTLESENEEELSRILEMIQNVEQKTREVDYSLDKYEQAGDSNLNFFSPVGIYEEEEEKRRLLQESEELSTKMPVLLQKLEQYKSRKEQIQYIRSTFLEVQKEKEGTSGKCKQLVKKQGLYILESQETDRNRIARDLHDSSVQSMTCLMHKTELCIRLMDMDSVRVKLELRTMLETIKSIINGMREIIYNLRPISLDNLGLVATIDSYCLQLRKNYGLEVILENLEKEPELTPIYKITIYRILQEACSNIIKHAKASKISISLFCKDNTLKLVVQDDGSGFDISDKSDTESEMLQGFGLTMMKERVALLGGTSHIDSVVGKGTTVSIEIPLQKEEEMTEND